MRLELELHQPTVDAIDHYVASANAVLGRQAYTRESAARAILQDWARGRQTAPRPSGPYVWNQRTPKPNA